MLNQDNVIESNEFITRSLISGKWVVDNLISPTAFDWQEGETYLSVNREIIGTYIDDLRDFVKRHPVYAYNSNGKQSVMVARMSVANVDTIHFSEKGIELSAEVSVSPRDKNYKSHAGIFAKSNGKNINKDRTAIIEPRELGVSADIILQRLRMELVRISSLKEVLL